MAAVLNGYFILNIFHIYDMFFKMDGDQELYIAGKKHWTNK